MNEFLNKLEEEVRVYLHDLTMQINNCTNIDTTIELLDNYRIISEIFDAICE